MTYSDKLFLLLSFMKKKCKYKDEKFLVEKKKAKLVKRYLSLTFECPSMSVISRTVSIIK